MLEELSDVHFPDAEQITLVEDNLSRHTAASLYSAFSAPEPLRKTVRMALHSQTGKLARHAESELGDWQFATDDARVKLERLNPHFEGGD